MSVQTLAPAPLHDDRHPGWCNPTECEPGDAFTFDGRTVLIEAIHVRTVAEFDALHKGDNRSVPVRLVREQCGDEDYYLLHVGDAVARVTAVQLEMLRGVS